MAGSFSASTGSQFHSTGHVLKLRKVERLRPFETGLGEHLNACLIGLPARTCTKTLSGASLRIAACRAEVPTSGDVLRTSRALARSARDDRGFPIGRRQGPESSPDCWYRAAPRIPGRNSDQVLC